MELGDLDGLVSVPSLSEPRFMQAHFLATQLGILPHRDRIMRTVDTGGAGPITSLLEAAEMIERDQADVVAVVAGSPPLSSVDPLFNPLTLFSIVPLQLISAATR